MNATTNLYKKTHSKIKIYFVIYMPVFHFLLYHLYFVHPDANSGQFL